MDSKYFKIVLLIIFSAILVFGYLRSGKTYHKSVGFGYAKITVRSGSFSYDYYSDQIRHSDTTLGITNLLGDNFEFTPVSFLSSGKYFSEITNKEFLKIKCGNRDYLIPKNQKEAFFMWISKEIGDMSTDPQLPIQPYFVEEGDNHKQLDYCTN